MRLKELTIQLYDLPFLKEKRRTGALLRLLSETGEEGAGEIAPLPGFSQETLEEALTQLKDLKGAILDQEWCRATWLAKVKKFPMSPSLSFGLESALFSLLEPIKAPLLPVCALLMGSPEEILKRAALRKAEGFTHAKLKVSQFSFNEAATLIERLKTTFRLRVDVNRAWSTEEALRFFSPYPLDTFDYVEEPFQNPIDLPLFPHPLAIDESFPKDLTLKELESIPSLKTLVYKPTIQGGMSRCLPLYKWTRKRNLSLVLSSSFESPLGLAAINSLAHHLSLSTPLGIDTLDHLCLP